MCISPSVLPLAAKQRLKVCTYQERADCTLHQKSLKQTDHILHIVDVHLSLVFFLFWVGGWYEFTETFICFRPNKTCCIFLKKTINHFEFSVRHVHRLNNLQPQPATRRLLKTLPFCRCCTVPAGFCLPQGKSFHLSHAVCRGVLCHIKSNYLISCQLLT